MADRQFILGGESIKSKDLGDGTGALTVSPAQAACLGGEIITPNGANVAATLPAGANLVAIAAVGGDVYYGVNLEEDADATNTPGFVAQNQHWIEGPLSNLVSLKFYAAAGAAAARLTYYSA